MRMTTFNELYLPPPVAKGLQSTLVLALLSPLLFALGSVTNSAWAVEPAPLAGTVEAKVDGKRLTLPLLRSHYDVTIQGDIATVRLTQTFANPSDQPLNARYLFPLNRRAAVHAMTMRVGDEVISAEIQEIVQAKQTFEQAKREGKAAALLEQHRPNMFTQRIANLMPGVPVAVDIEYAQLVPKVDEAYELIVPMIVGPRFQPAEARPGPADVLTPAGPASVADGRAPAADGQWQLEALPAYPPTAGVHLPDDRVSERVTLALALETPVALQSVYSDTHPLTLTHHSSTQVAISFEEGAVLDNRDFVLRYDYTPAQASAGAFTHWESGEGGYFALLIEPPKTVPDSAALPREMVFLLDCSGSMSGAPMAASKLFMHKALNGLRPKDSFRIIRFSDSATEFSAQPLSATRANIERGLRYTQQLYGSGGTVMTSGIKQALLVPPPTGVIRNVVFLTDGYIGNELSVLALVNKLLGDARLFAFGVGAGVNRYLLDELGRVGRGFTRYFDPTRSDETKETVAAELAAKLHTPVLTDLRIDWGGLPVNEVVPAELPDLYAGNSIRITGRFTRPATGVVTIAGTRGTANGTASQARVSHELTLSEAESRPAIRRVWARNAIGERMHQFITPKQLRPDAVTNDQLKAAVTELGLSYGLATRWTAFVAVSKKIYNQTPAAARDADVALPKVAGVSRNAYGPPSTGPITGFAAPEPGLWLSLPTAVLILAVLRRRARRRERIFH